MLHAYYNWEWLSDLAIIPAFEIFLIGIMLGGTTMTLILWTERRKDNKVTQLQLIEALCGLVENLVRIVKTLATKLEQVEALDEAERQEVDAALARYTEILGADETPDCF